MMQDFGMYGGSPDLFGWMFSGFALLMVWSIFWKGLALWHAAKRDEKIWFIALLLINTAGILEIIYLFLVAKIKWENLFGSEKKPENPVQ